MTKTIIIKENQLIFTKINLIFSIIEYKDVFMNKNNKTLLETIESKKYKHLKQDVDEKYSNYLNMGLGLFLKQLKCKKDLFYKKFLNPYGDLIYSEYKINDTKILSKKGLYIYCINDELKYVGRSKDPFGKRINNGYGKISPKNCYLDGQSTNCRINYLITENKNNIQLFVLELTNDEFIKSCEKELINKYKPEWNKQV